MYTTRSGKKIVEWQIFLLLLNKRNCLNSDELIIGDFMSLYSLKGEEK